MATLTNTKIKDTYDGLLKTTDNDVIGASEKVITDGLGNASVLSIGTASASFSNSVSITGGLTASTGVTTGSVYVDDAIGHNGDTDTKIEFLNNQMKVTVGGTLAINTIASGTEFYQDAVINGLTVGKGSGDLGSNAVLGFNALDSNTTGASNTAIGSTALNANTTGSQNTALGNSALYTNIIGGSNTALGYYALRNNTVSNNTAIGHNALAANTTGGVNTAVGKDALNSNTTGGGNTAIGYQALQTQTAQSSNTAIGHLALKDNVASNNTAVGSQALTANTTGGSNVAVGLNALNSNTTSSNTTAIGRSAMANATGGNNNTAVGFYSLVENQGTANVAVGDYALGYNTTGGYNTALGSNSLRNNTTGAFNSALGKDALNANTTGTYNIGIGTDALNSNVDGDRNIAVGYAAGDSKTSGDDNIYIGQQADGASATTSNEIVIGSGATGNGSNTATYGNASITDHIFTSGNVGIGTNLPTEDLQIQSVGNSFIYMSSGTASPATLGMRMGQSISSGAAQAEVSFDVQDDLFQIKTGTAASTRRLTIDSSGNLAVDTNTLYVDAANNKVGINNSTPNSFFSNASQLVVGDGSTSRGMTIYGSSAGDSQIFFADGTTGDEQYRGAVRYEHSSDSMVMFTSGSEKVRIDSSGNVGIGTSSPTSAGGYAKTLQVSDASAASISVSRTSATASSIEIGTFSGSNLIDSIGSGIPLRFKVDGSERMRIDSSGRVGIGTSTLNTISGSNPTLTLAGTGITGGLILQNSGTDTARIYETGNLLIHQGMSGIGHSFYVNAVSEAMRIDSSGNIIYNLPSIGGTRDIQFPQFAASNAKTIIRATGTSDFRQHLDILMNTAQADVAPTTVVRIDNGGNVGIGTSSPSAKIQVNDATSSKIRFLDTTDFYYTDYGRDGIDAYTNTNSSAPIFFKTGGTERMRITSGGEIRTYFPSVFGQVHRYTGSTATVYPIVFEYGLGTKGSISMTTSAVAYNTTSDYRAKENVVEMTGALDRVDALKPSRFNFIADPEKTVDGFLAHEVQAIVPEAVTGEKDAIDEEGNPIYQGIDQSKIVPLLVGAIKELSAKVAALESQLNA